MTQQEIASSVKNKVADGLSGNITDQAFSLEQLYDEIDLARADFINKYAPTSKLNPKYLLQTIDDLELVCTSLTHTDCCVDSGISSGDEVPAVEIPPVMATFDDSAIEYVGLNNKQEKFSVYFSTSDIALHRVRVRTAHRPFVWVDTTLNCNNNFTLYFFNMGKYNPLKFVSIRAVFNHPGRVGDLDPDFLEKEYPAPLHMQNAIIDTLTEKYVRYFRQLNVDPRTTPQTNNDPIT